MAAPASDPTIFTMFKLLDEITEVIYNRTETLIGIHPETAKKYKDVVDLAHSRLELVLAAMQRHKDQRKAFRRDMRAGMERAVQVLADPADADYVDETTDDESKAP